jgi:hypothetical protein
VWIYDKITGGPQEIIEEEDAPVVPEVKEEASAPADAPVLLQAKVEETVSAETATSEEEPPADDTSAVVEFLGCLGFLVATLACLFLPSFMLGFLIPLGRDCDIHCLRRPVDSLWSVAISGFTTGSPGYHDTPQCPRDHPDQHIQAHLALKEKSLPCLSAIVKGPVLYVPYGLDAKGRFKPRGKPPAYVPYGL